MKLYYTKELYEFELRKYLNFCRILSELSWRCLYFLILKLNEALFVLNGLTKAHLTLLDSLLFKNANRWDYKWDYQAKL